MKTIFREQMEQDKLTEDKKKNLIIHSLKSIDGVSDKKQFLNIVKDCGLEDKITESDVLECSRIGKKKVNELQPLKVVLTSVDMKKVLFRNLGKWRAKLDMDRDPNERLPQVDHDLTREQREERKTLVEIAKKKQAELPDDSPFRIRVRGSPREMKVVQIDSNNKWTVLDLNLLV